METSIGNFPLDLFKKYTVTFDSLRAIKRDLDVFTFAAIIDANKNDVSRISITPCDLIVEFEESPPQEIESVLYLYWRGVDSGIVNQPSNASTNNTTWNRIGFAYQWAKSIPIGDVFKNPREIYRPVSKEQFVHSSSDLMPLYDPVLTVRTRDQLNIGAIAGADNLLNFIASFVVTETRKNPPVDSDAVLLGTDPVRMYTRRNINLV